MKKILLFLVFSIELNASLFSQNINQSQSELETLLIKQWEIEYAMLGTTKIEQMPGAKDFNILFNLDGTYQLIEDTGNVITGKWIFFPEKKYVELAIGEKISSRIISLEKDKMILIIVSGKEKSPDVPNSEIHFKPI